MVFFKKLYNNACGGTAVDHALFLCAISLLLVGGVAIVGNQLTPQIVAWKDRYQVIDRDTITASIRTQAPKGALDGYGFAKKQSSSVTYYPPEMDDNIED